MLYVSDIHSVKYAKIRASSDLYFLIYDSVHIPENKNMILFIYRKTQIGESQHFGIFYAVIRQKQQFHNDFTILKHSFFQRLIVIEIVVSEITEKKLSKLLLSKTFYLFSYFLFLKAVSDCKSKNLSMFWKTAVNKILAKLKDKSFIRINSCNLSHNFRQFSEKF